MCGLALLDWIVRCYAVYVAWLGTDIFTPIVRHDLTLRDCDRSSGVLAFT